VQRWHEVEEFLLGEAARDLINGVDVHPCLMAYAGEHALFVAFLRPFPKGGYADPMIELLALAAPLAADQLALSMAGRAWSLLDPIPPVLADVGDLRQRVVVLQSADGRAGRVRLHSRMFPFELTDGSVRWGEPLRYDGDTGWMTGALALAIRHRRRISGPPAQIRRQAERCVALGHLLALAPAVHDRLGLARASGA
jgi:hypothetical protein